MSGEMWGWVVRCDDEWWDVMMSRWWEWVYGLGFREDRYYLFDASTCAKDANYSQTIRITRFLYFIFSTKAHQCWSWPAHIWWCANVLTCSCVENSSWSHLRSWMSLDWRFHEASLLRLEYQCFCFTLSQRAFIQTIILILFTHSNVVWQCNQLKIGCPWRPRNLGTIIEGKRVNGSYQNRWCLESMGPPFQCRSSIFDQTL